MLRRLLLAHYTPRPHGQLLQPPFCEGVWGAQPEANHLAKIRWLQENRIPTECYWIDAGWYGDRPLAEAADGLSSGWMRQVGSWFVNPEAYPRGFKPISDAAQAAGLGFLLWVEPERAFEGTQLVREHPDWLIGPVPSGNTNGLNFMVNLGIPEARRHMTELVSNLIRDGGITCYRQDFNDLRVPELFALADAPDRVGMAEIQHITGLYAFWDELLARHPGLIIDNCAGGGQRIDLETIARTVPLWRSDLQCWPFDPIAMQTQTQGLAPWIPLSAAVCEAPTQYALRSALGPGLVTHWSSQALDGRVDLPVDDDPPADGGSPGAAQVLLRRLLSIALLQPGGRRLGGLAIRPARPGRGHGGGLPPPRSPLRTLGSQPPGSGAGGEVRVCSWDDGHTWRSLGRALMTDGFDVTITDKPGSALFTYKRVT